MDTNTASTTPAPASDAGSQPQTLAPAATPETALPPASTPAPALPAGNSDGPESQPKRGPSPADYAEMLTGEALEGFVAECPKELLPRLYQAGEQIRVLVNRRWEKGE